MTKYELEMQFDYGEISTRDQSYLEKRACEIEKRQERVRRTAVEEMFKIAEMLQEAHDKLANHHQGTFGKWVEQRLGMNRSTAFRMMNAHKHLGCCCTVQQHFDATACYLLSSDSCPEDATKEAIKRAEKGEQITAKVAREIISKFKEEAEEEETEEDRKMSSYDLMDEVSEQIEEAWRLCPDGERTSFWELLDQVISKAKERINEDSSRAD